MKISNLMDYVNFLKEVACANSGVNYNHINLRVPVLNEGTDEFTYYGFVLLIKDGLDIKDINARDLFYPEENKDIFKNGDIIIIFGPVPDLKDFKSFLCYNLPTFDMEHFGYKYKPASRNLM